MANSEDLCLRFEMVMKTMMIETATAMTENLFLGSNDLVSIVFRWASYPVSTKDNVKAQVDASSY